MSRGLRTRVRCAGLLLALAACRGVTADPAGPDRPTTPNVVLILTDDQGYGDLACYGSPTLRTPRLDALAAGGLRLTQFYVAGPVCSPSRAALLTGCYPARVGMHRRVVFPQDDHGLHPDELTLAELLRARGYTTGCFGKWHLGHRPGLLPTDQGFDVFEGVPYSNDMAQFHRAPGSRYVYRLPWMRQAEVVEWEPDQHALTRRTTDAALAFIEAHADEPFFVYLPYSMPHVPLFASAEFAGASPRGTYGDVLRELDASVGRVVDTLERLGLRRDTLVLFTSDNGPWLERGEDGGSAGPLRGGKGTTWEGGLRVPFLASWPGTIEPARVGREVVTALDLLPTLAALTGAPPPAGRAIDGHDVSALLLGAPGATSATESFLYYESSGELGAIRRGRWKLRLSSGELFDLERDPGERRDRAGGAPEVVARLEALGRARAAEIAAHARPAAHVKARLFDPRRPAD